MHVIPNGVDVDRFCPRPADHAAAAHWACPADAPWLAFSRRYGRKRITRCFSKLRLECGEEIPAAHFLLDRRRRAAADLGAIGRRNGAARGGSFPRHSARRAGVAWPCSTSCCSPRTSKPIPVSILEALAGRQAGGGDSRRIGARNGARSPGGLSGRAGRRRWYGAPGDRAISQSSSCGSSGCRRPAKRNRPLVARPNGPRLRRPLAASLRRENRSPRPNVERNSHRSEIGGGRPNGMNSVLLTRPVTQTAARSRIGADFDVVAVRVAEEQLADIASGTSFLRYWIPCC